MYYILLLFFIINSAGANQQQIKFHKAETDAEKALDKIMRMNDGLPVEGIDQKEICIDMSIFISEGGSKLDYKSNKKCQQKTKDLFATFFTQELIDDTTKQQNECNKNPNKCTQWDTGYVMISDVNYISCAQDNPQNYLYYTVKTEDNKAYILKTWDIFAKDNEAYHNQKSANFPTANRIMKYEDGHWKLDGICCSESRIMLNCH